MPAGAEHRMVATDRREFLARDGLSPDRAAECVEHGARIALATHPSIHQDRHALAHIRHVVHDVGREHNNDVFADLAQQPEKASALLGVESSSRLVDDDEARVADEGLRDPESLAHAAGERAELRVYVCPTGW